MTAHAGILEALIERQNTGRGKAIEVSLFGVTADWMTVPLLHNDYGGKAPGRVGLNHPSIAPYGGYLTKDNETVIIAIQNEREWQRLCEGVLQMPEQATAEDFCSNNQRVANRSGLDAMINKVTETLQKDALIERLRDADIAYGSVNSVADFSSHPALTRRSGIASSGQSINYPTRPVGETNEQREVPSIGQHSAAIRKEFSHD
jgi:crotonobetainyl-CoA:carnitine CoA-transferase CaiB-like acyl-CoA transferase